ncbi:MAG: rhodanese-like domain-containing protein [Asticcacaulis sp.]
MRHHLMFAGVALALLLPASALAATKDVSACHPGKDPQSAGSDWAGGLHPSSHGLTPVALKGTTTVSAYEARCLSEQLGKELVVVSVIPDGEQLPGFIDAYSAETYVGAESPQADQSLSNILTTATGADKTRPLLFYCRDADCFMSYNAALRAVRLGYREIYWLRPGLEAWKKADYPLDLSTMYRDVVQSSDLSARLDAQIAQAAKAAESEIVQVRGDTPFTEAEAKRFMPLYNDTFVPLKDRLIDRFVRDEYPQFSPAEIRKLNDATPSGTETAEQKKLTALRNAPDGVARLAWVREEIERTRARFVAGILHPEAK